MNSLFFIIILVLISMPLGLNAQPPGLASYLITDTPTIDGILSDNCWQKSPSVSSFYYSPDGTTATEPTTAWICYDQAHIYAAFYCKDSQPDTIVALQKKRGGTVSTDDYVEIKLDCMSDYRVVSWFRVSAGGVQLESVPAGDVSNIQWKGDWFAVAKRTSDGYTVEMKIPFSILQYDSSRSRMGVAFIRRNARSNQEWWAPNVGANSDTRRFYAWDGLRLPKAKQDYTTMAYALFGGGEDKSIADIGLDVKGQVTPGLSALATINPDFRNIEQGVDSVDFSYTQRLLPDSRPFFQQGTNYAPGYPLFYSRKVLDIDTGINISGKYAGRDIAFMRTDNFGNEDHNVLQIGNHITDRSTFWLGAIQSNVKDKSFLTTHIQFDQILHREDGKEITLNAWHSMADAADRNSNGGWTNVAIESTARPHELSWNIKYQKIDEDFLPYLGLHGEIDIRKISSSIAIYDKPNNGQISGWKISLGSDIAEHLDGSRFYNATNISSSLSLRDGRSLSLSAESSDRPPNRDNVMRSRYSWGGNNLYSNGGVSIASGKLVGGDYLYGKVSQGWKISDRLSASLSYEYGQIMEPSPNAFISRQYTETFTYDLDNERTFGGRFIIRNSESNLYLAFKQRVRFGTDIYVIFGDPNSVNTSKSCMVKLVRTL